MKKSTVLILAITSFTIFGAGYSAQETNDVLLYNKANIRAGAESAGKCEQPYCHEWRPHRQATTYCVKNPIIRGKTIPRSGSKPATEGPIGQLQADGTPECAAPYEGSTYKMCNPLNHTSQATEDDDTRNTGHCEVQESAKMKNCDFPNVIYTCKKNEAYKEPPRTTPPTLPIGKPFIWAGQSYTPTSAEENTSPPMCGTYPTVTYPNDTCTKTTGK